MHGDEITSVGGRAVSVDNRADAGADRGRSREEGAMYVSCLKKVSKNIII